MITRVLPVIIAILGVSGAGLLAACGDDTNPVDPPQEESCTATDEDFVESAILAVLGRRAWGTAEVQVYASMLDAVRARDGEEAGRRAVARALTADPMYRARWANFFMDSLQVSRTRFRRDQQYGLQEATSCYGPPSVTPEVGPELAAYVRDTSPSTAAPPMPSFTLGMLMNSALELDDISPIYRAHVFHLLTFPIAGANVDPDELERSRRNTFGVQFEETYLNRNPSCLPCHNSEFSVTPDRTYPVTGKLEEALYGTSIAPEDPLVYRSVFRTDGVLDGSRAPWGWNAEQCGAFDAPNESDPLGYETRFGSIGVDALEGRRASVWQLELALSRGFALLRDGFEVGGDGRVASSDEALARLVVMRAVEGVWQEMMGSGLTIAHHFPRNEAQRDVLASLADGFARSGYSMRHLLEDIVAHPLFAVPPADDSCWESAYPLDPVFDPFATSDSDPAKRGNGAGDATVIVSSRSLVSSLHAAMDWPPPNESPNSDDDEVWHASIGLFLNTDLKGFRGLDLQARLAWEERYGTCERGVEGDFIDGLIGLAAADPEATLKDVVIALRDRLWSDSSELAPEERAAVEELLGASLDAKDVAAREVDIRLLCGALVASPQFMLAGVGDGSSASSVPRLVAPERTVAALCETVRDRNADWLALDCTAGGATVR